MLEYLQQFPQTFHQAIYLFCRIIVNQADSNNALFGIFKAQSLDTAPGIEMAVSNGNEFFRKSLHYFAGLLFQRPKGNCCCPPTGLGMRLTDDSHPRQFR